MNMDKKLIALIAIIALGIIYFVAIASDTKMEQEAIVEGGEAAMMESEDRMEAGDAMVASGDVMQAEDSMMEGGDHGMDMSKGAYETYAPEKLAWAEDGGKVVLFFKASWCPSCRALDADLKASLGDIPAGVTILELDYDDETELKKKYGVTTQHTLVQVDANGEMITKWSGGNSLASVVSKIK
jgi:thiol-disulfide isomerase/thioredoxin